MYNHLWWKPGWNCVWWKPGWNFAPRNGWKSRLSTSPNGEHDGEDDAIHEGDYAQVETDGSVFCWRRLRKEATYASSLYLGRAAAWIAAGVWQTLVVVVLNVLNFVIDVLPHGWRVRVNA